MTAGAPPPGAASPGIFPRTRNERGGGGVWSPPARMEGRRSPSPAAVRRLRLLLQGPFAAVVVVWAGVVAGVNMAPDAAWTPFGIRVQGDAVGRDLRAPDGRLVQPLIAEVPGVRPEIPPAEEAGDRRGPAVPPATSEAGSRSWFAKEAADRHGPGRVGFGGGTGIVRCRWLCTYRL